MGSIRSGWSWSASSRCGTPCIAWCIPSPLSAWCRSWLGLLAALGNWGVAHVLKKPAQTEPAIRLAYVHNRGDALVSLAPVVAGLGVMVLRTPLVDPLVALGIGMAILVPTLQTLVSARQALLWPEGLSCGPADAHTMEGS